MLDTCSMCEKLVDVDGYIPLLHGPLFCEMHQPECVQCEGPEYLGVCPRCNRETWNKLKEIKTKLYGKSLNS